MTAIAVTQPSRLEMSEQERFFRYFRTEVAALQEQMQIIQDHGTSGGERADAIDHCLAGISRLSNDVKDISGSLPAHDQRTYSEVGRPRKCHYEIPAIKALSDKLQKTRAQAAPKPKFSFKKKNASAISINDAAELAAKRRLLQPNSNFSSNASSFATTPLTMPQTPANGPVETETDNNRTDEHTTISEGIRKMSFSKATKINISNHNNIHIMLPSSATHATSGTSGTVTNVRNSVIDMSISSTSAFATLTLKNVKESLIVCGHVDGAVHITGVEDSVLVVATRQFRMHESKNVKVYMLCKSRPIIEDCEGIEFAELPGCYATEKDAEIQNLYDQVDDFKWLKAEHSPNWSVLDKDKYIKNEVWKDIVPGSPTSGVEDILKAVGV
ncbi:TBCC-domain-containing protein [Aureobasidium pullulans]|uniref:TBCC-domain-containing protein n=1 Tax=Aureobasidium pullulans TaxID=5580 RepID=A0A4S8WXS6_AURPU|nr:TBCC-domain-containing protein [Aureobasidium pullulans]